MRQQVAPFRFGQLGLNQMARVIELNLELKRIPDCTILGATVDDDRPANALAVDGRTRAAFFALVDPDTYVVKN